MVFDGINGISLLKLDCVAFLIGKLKNHFHGKRLFKK